MSETVESTAQAPCSDASRARDEPQAATASRVARWLLVEHRGAWGPQSVPSSRMTPNVARALAQTAGGAGARLVLVRRPHGAPQTDGRHVFAVDSSPGGERIRTRHVADDTDLTRLGWDDEDWAAYDGPLYLVCTHGRHDRCCALRGRPVAQALSRAHPERTWESSHIGGDRFAPNLVVLPEGLYFGRVEVGDAVRLVEELAAGRLPAGHVRGRSSLPLPTQAAQGFAREQLGLWGVHELVPAGQAGLEPDVWRVRLAQPDVEVVVRYDRAGGGTHRLTCDAEQDKPVPVFRQVSLRVGAPAP
ncbi:MAG: sucrase ferredoxin [Frankiales bacterium]|nr:MAG: sucrase ferredoxin [Frankiales bacterium]